MKKILVGILAAIALMITAAPSLHAAEAEELVLTWFETVDLSSCNFEDSDNYDGGVMVYGCNTWSVDEAYTDYNRAGSATYQAQVETGNGLRAIGPIKNNGDVSSAQIQFEPGTQKYGIWE